MMKANKKTMTRLRSLISLKKFNIKRRKSVSSSARTPLGMMRS